MSLAKQMLDKEITKIKKNLKKSIRFNAIWILSLIVINIALAIPAILNGNEDSLWISIISILWLLVIWPLYNQNARYRSALEMHHAKDFFEEIERVEKVMDKELGNVLKKIFGSTDKVSDKKGNKRSAKSGTRSNVSSSDDKATSKPVEKSK